MNPDSPQFSRDLLEARLTALLLGELTPAEEAEVRRALEQDPELSRLHDRLKVTVPLVRETLAAPATAASEPRAPRLSKQRRQRLLRQFKIIAPKELASPRWELPRWLVPLGAAAAIIVLLAAISIPNFTRARESAALNTVANNLRILEGAKEQYALENKLDPSAPVAMNDLLPYLKGGSPIHPVLGETYSVATVGDLITAEGRGLRGKTTVESFGSVTRGPSDRSDLRASAATDREAEVRRRGETRVGSRVMARVDQTAPADAASTEMSQRMMERYGLRPRQTEPGGQPQRLAEVDSTAGGIKTAAVKKPAAAPAKGVQSIYLPSVQEPEAIGVAGQSAGRALAQTVSPDASRALSERAAPVGRTGGDFDNDGNLDLYVHFADTSGRQASAGDTTWFYRNSGNADFGGGGGIGGGGGGGFGGGGGGLRDSAAIPPQGAKGRWDVAAAGAQSQKQRAGALVQDGKRLYEMGRLDEAEARLKSAAASDPSNQAAYYYGKLIAEARYQNGAREREVVNKGTTVEMEKSWLPPSLPAQARARVERGAEGPTPVAPSQGVAGVPEATTATDFAFVATTTGPTAPPVALATEAPEQSGRDFFAGTEVRATPIEGNPGGVFPGSFGVPSVPPTATAPAGAEELEPLAIKLPTPGLVGTPADVPAARTSKDPEQVPIPDRIPILGDVPLVGRLFRSERLHETANGVSVTGKPVLAQVLELAKLNEEIRNAQAKTDELRAKYNISDATEKLMSLSSEELAKAPRLVAKPAEEIAKEKAEIEAKHYGGYFELKAELDQLQALRGKLAKSEERLAEATATEVAAAPLADEEKKVVSRPIPAPVPQPEVPTADNPFSTFSLNVSDVSFKLAASSLENGALPDPAGIRSEEFINAFDYHDPEPAPGLPLAFAWERARTPFAHNRDLLRLSLQTAARGREPGRPLNLVLLLDNSGSMERADRVAIIREALRVLAGQLQPQDRISVVAFSRTPRLWIDGLSGAQAGELVERVGNLQPQGGTNLEDALRLAYETATRHYLPNGMNRVVLLTDGAANLGDVDPESLKQKVESNRKQGIALDCFGIGWEGYNDDLLEVLARNGDGRYGFVNTPEEAAVGFANQLAGALQVAAADVKVQVEFNPQRVTAWRQIGYAKHQLTKEQFRDNTVDAAEIGAAETGNALYTMEVNPRGEGPLGMVRARFKVPTTGEYREFEWELPYLGEAAALDQSSPAMRLAGAAATFSEWLASSPFAAEVSPDDLLKLMAGVPEVFGADARPKKLEWMIRQAKSLAGK